MDSKNNLLGDLIQSLTKNKKFKQLIEKTEPPNNNLSLEKHHLYEEILTDLRSLYFKKVKPLLINAFKEHRNPNY